MLEITNDIGRYSEQETDILLRKFHEYSLVSEKLKKAKRQLLILKPEGGFDVKKMEEQKPQYEAALGAAASLSRREQELSDSMKFQNPIIWLLYKKRAYQDTSKQMDTAQDFANHLISDTICDVRMMFLNTELKKRNEGKDFLDLFNDTDLELVAKSKQIQDVVQDSKFMNSWRAFENNRRSESVSNKWFVQEGPYKGFKTDPEIRKRLLDFLTGQNIK